MIIEADPNTTGYPRGECIVGRGTEADTLRQAHVEEAVGIVVGTNDDVNNLSIIMTARELNPKLFIVLRQNKADNQIIFEAAKADIIMQPSKIIANHIRVLLTTPLLIDFIRLVKQRGNDWINHLISRFKKILNETSPTIWQLKIDPETAPAICEALSQGNLIQLECLVRDPRNRTRNLACIPLLIVRNTKTILLPDESENLAIGDQLLWCGKPPTADWMTWTLRDPFVLIYLATGQTMPRSYLWRWLQQRFGNQPSASSEFKMRIL